MTFKEAKTKKRPTNEKLEKIFKERIEELPETLNGWYKYYFNLKGTVRLYLDNKDYKNLHLVWVDLYNKEGWNADRPKLDRFKNKNE